MLDRTPTKDELADKIIFKGVLHDREHVLFKGADHKILKPIIAVSSAIFRMFTFLQIERVPGKRFTFSIWSLLSQTACKGIFGVILIKPKNHKCFTAHLPILPILSSTKRQAIVDGNVFELYDPQLKPDNPNESVVFE